MIPDRTETIARLNSYLNQQQIDDAVEMLAQFHPADIADLLESLEEEEKRAVFQKLNTEVASEVIAHLSEFSREQILSDLSHRRLGQIVDEMDSDDAADLLTGMPEEVVEKVLARIDAEDSEHVRRLLVHGEGKKRPVASCRQSFWLRRRRQLLLRRLIESVSWVRTSTT